MVLSNIGPPAIADSKEVAQVQPSKLHNAAQQFEALMIGEMLRSQRESGSDGWLGSGDDSGGDSAMDYAEAQVSNAIAAGGGLGLAKMIEKTLSSPGPNVQAT